MDELRERLVRTERRVRLLLALWAATIAAGVVLAVASSSGAQTQLVRSLRVEELEVGRLRMPIGGGLTVVALEPSRGLAIKEAAGPGGVVIRMGGRSPEIILTDTDGKVIWRAP